ncbi:MAG: M50 family metallopeptidase [Deltaproteobacteria bacterium]|nr:M50 family metallopeptidase [Deltaproteobacteria bacterium]
MRALAIALVISAGLLGPALRGAAPAGADPTDRTLFFTGLALAPPTYLIGVGLHEGSHALAAKLVGAEVLDVHLFPPGRDPRANKFRFGWTYVRGLKGRHQRIFFFLAPKITDAALLGGFTALVLSDAWPQNRYGQLALTVFATGLWIDFAKDVVLFSKQNDVVRAFDLWCMKGWKQLPARLLYGGLVVGLGLVVARGYQRTFDDAGASDAIAARILPVASGRF